MTVDFDALVLAPCMDAFAQLACTYVPAGGAAFSLRGVFDRHGGAVVLDQDAAPASIRQPRLGVRLAEFPAGVTPAQGDIVTIPGQGDWMVKDVQPDGLGGCTLPLAARGGVGGQP